MAARTLLLKLERRGCIELPARQRPSSNQFRNQRVPVVEPVREAIRGSLSDLRPLSVSLVAPRSEELGLFKGLLGQYHYLGHRQHGRRPTYRQAGNLRYLVSDRQARPVACALFGSAAWKCADRDRFLGWNRSCREHNLSLLTNNTRFLILPWVQVSHLASHVLGLIARRSIALALDGELVGNVTIPPNHKIPAVGQVVEIRYLYVTDVGGSLYQPISLGVRGDVCADECTVARQNIKYRDYQGS